MNLKNLLAGLAAMLPAIGETVIALHPNNPNEAFKIRLGEQLITGVTATLVQSATEAAEAAAQPHVASTPAQTVPAPALTSPTTSAQNVVPLAAPSVTAPTPTASPDLAARAAELAAQLAATTPAAVGNS